MDLPPTQPPTQPTKVADTDRLVLRELTVDDAPFILKLLNDPGWIRFIGDRGVRDEESARDYLLKGPMAMYRRVGFGLYCVARKDGDVPIGMCGLIKRDNLADVDLGYALLPEFRGKGYASEASLAALALGRERFGLKRIVAITSRDNDDSVALLEKLGFVFESLFEFKPGDMVNLFAIEV